jgi:hypothetical protein
LVFALKKLKLCEPLKDGIRDFRSSGLVLVLNDGNVCVQGFEISLFAVSGGDRLVEVVADWFPRARAVSQRIPQEVGTGEIGGAAPTSEIDLLIAPSLAFADLAIDRV